MKKHLGVMVLTSLVLVLAGCKLEHNSRVKYSQLKNDFVTIDTVAQVEVAACNDYKDNTKPSDSLTKVNAIMKKVFPDSEFEECKIQNMKSVASYTVPMEIGQLPPEATDYTPKGISLIRNQGGTVFFFLSQGVRDQIAAGKKDPMTKDIALNVNIRVTNDTAGELKLNPHAIFVDNSAFAGLPSWGNFAVIKTKQARNITLSDVSTEFALQTGVAPVFTEMQDSPDTKQ